MNKFITKVGAALLVILIAAAGCSVAAEPETATTTNNVSTEGLFGTYEDEDLDATWDDASATHITLSDSASTIDGEGAVVNGSGIKITAAGTYVLTGMLTNGQVLISATANDKVRIILNGVTINNDTSAAIYVEQADKVIMTLASDTKNTISDGSTYTFADAATDEPNATIFSKDDLTINGDGQLTVTANYLNGIISKDDLIITGGTYAITANNNGIRGRDVLSILDGNFTITAKNDAIQSNNDTGEEGKGVINLDGGTYDLTADHDGVDAKNQLNISHGTYTVKSGGGSSQSANSSDTESYKGLKAASAIHITGGTFNIDAKDDAIHTNGDTNIEGGTFTLATGDDGIHSDNTTAISGGEITITKSYEGIEGSDITISGGTISIVSSDDGINAAGGSDGDTETGPFGGDQFAAGDYTLTISDGTVYVNAGGDGLDSNGDIVMTGGTVVVDGPEDNGNGALDYDGNYTISGGILIAAGSSGMAQAPGTDSSQASLGIYFNSTQSAGQTINISSSDGTNILSYTPSKSYSSVIVSAPELKNGSSYSVSTGGTDTGSTVNSLQTGGSYSNGSKLVDITLSSSVTLIDESGSAVQGGMGAPGGGMGGGPGGNRP
ncbi:carbohydrate-binding domain-containing protein [Culicoidibacter larvae]|nr:carbohydrate-binding domain-containing protein [Culicoidibacter larvae]